MEIRYERMHINDCIDDGLRAWVDGHVSLEEIRELHNQVSELNRQAATQENFENDVLALRFMHQVTKGIMGRLKTSGRQIGVKQQYKSAQANSGDV